jgi:molybdopterin-containing oxidoreductase family iron-sulfur binding subunit
MDPDRLKYPTYQDHGKGISTRAAKIDGDFRPWAKEHFSKFDATKGKGLAFLVDKRTSPSRDAVRERLKQRFGEAMWVPYEASDSDSAAAGSAAAFNSPKREVLTFSAGGQVKAKVIVSLDRDFLEQSDPANLSSAREFAATRRVLTTKDPMSRLYVIEPAFSQTGSCADHRLRLAPSRIAAFAVALARALIEKQPGLQLGPVAEAVKALQAEGADIPREFVSSVADDLLTEEDEHGGKVSRKGETLILAGPSQPAAVHALCHALNSALGNVGQTVRYLPMSADEAASSAAGVTALAKAIETGEIKTLVCINTNPVYDAPPELAFGEKIKHVTSICLSVESTETAAAANWCLNGAHYLESWGDTESWDGTVAPMQPMIAPLYEPALSDIELLALIADPNAGILPPGAASGTAATGTPKQARVDDGYQIVRAAWRQKLGAGVNEAHFEKLWRRALHDGIVTHEAFARPAQSAALDQSKVAAEVAKLQLAPAPYGVVAGGGLRHTPRARRALRQQRLAPGAATGRHAGGVGQPCAALPRDGGEARLPARRVHQVRPGHDVHAQVPFGQGRDGDRERPVDGHRGLDPARDGGQHGCSAARLRAHRERARRRRCGLQHLRGARRGLAAQRAGRQARQVHRRGLSDLEHAEPLDDGPSRCAADVDRAAGGPGGVAEVRRPGSAEGDGPALRDAEGPAELRRARQRRRAGARAAEPLHLPQPVQRHREPPAPGERDVPGAPQSIDGNLYGKKGAEPGSVYSKGPQWGMTIDMTTCTGCGACTIACQAENNIAIVGKKEVAKGREMTWIRVDRYFAGHDFNDPEQMLHQPVACVHCENAPCETVCPVNATVHGPEGINYMTYNRCIGTRYCANNCPYKVRRFNFFDYGVTRFNGDYYFKDIIEHVPKPSNHGNGSTAHNQLNPNLIPPRLREKLEQISRMQKNPDVTVRSRGVMEKCSYCIQRINAARIEMKLHDFKTADGGVHPRRLRAGGLPAGRAPRRDRLRRPPGQGQQQRGREHRPPATRQPAVIPAPGVPQHAPADDAHGPRGQSQSASGFRGAQGMWEHPFEHHEGGHEPAPHGGESKPHAMSRSSFLRDEPSGLPIAGTP